MSSLDNISITHTFNGDTAAANKVNAADLDIQLGNLASNQNDQKAVIDRVVGPDDDLAAGTVGYKHLKPELQAAFASTDGWQPKVECAVATTANITLSGEQTIDGVLTSASRILVKNQSTQSQNGIYTTGSGAWTRTTDADTGAELVLAVVSVTGGSTQSGSAWVTTNTTAPTIGTDAIQWAKAPGNAVSTAMTPVVQSGTVQIALNQLAGATTAARVLRGNGSNIVLAQVDLSTDVTGQLATANIADSAITTVKLAANSVAYDKIGTLSAWSRIVNPTEISITGATTATVNRMHVISGTSADYTIGVPASPTAGDVIGFRVKNYSLASKQYTIDAGVGILIAGRTRYLSLIHSNTALFEYDGVEWQAIALNLTTSWTVVSGLTITGSTADPTKPTTRQVDKLYWRRNGYNLECTYMMKYTSSAGSANGTGLYLLAIPLGTAEDGNTVNSLSTLGETVTDAITFGASALPGGGWFSADAGASARSMSAMAVLYSSTKVAIAINHSTGANASSNYWGSAGNISMTIAPVRFSVTATIPMVNW